VLAYRAFRPQALAVNKPYRLLTLPANLLTLFAKSVGVQVRSLGADAEGQIADMMKRGRPNPIFRLFKCLVKMEQRGGGNIFLRSGRFIGLSANGT
jgi:hypothetical protein